MAVDAGASGGELSDAADPSSAEVADDTSGEDLVSDEVVEPADADYDAESIDDEESSVDGFAKRGRSPLALALIMGIVFVVALGALTGYLGFRAHKAHAAEQERELLLQVARQGAVNLTTIDWQHADEDVQRILASATGTFYDDFEQRSAPFVDVVKKVQSKSVGTVTEAALESYSGDEGSVLLAVSVVTTSIASPQEDPRHWRMRVAIKKDGDQAKVSDVQFVP